MSYEDVRAYDRISRMQRVLKKKTTVLAATTWGKLWESALYTINEENMQKGKEIANAKAMIEMTIEPTLIDALVYYSVNDASLPKPRLCILSVSFTPLSDYEWSSVISKIAQSSLLYGQLLAGILSERIYGLFFQDLFPNLGKNELRSACSCKTAHCEHVCAILYTMIEKIDQDPYVIFTLRGKSRDKVLTTVEKIRNSRQPLPKRDARTFWQPFQPNVLLNTNTESTEPSFEFLRTIPGKIDKKDISRLLIASYKFLRHRVEKYRAS